MTLALPYKSPFHPNIIVFGDIENTDVDKDSFNHINLGEEGFAIKGINTEIQSLISKIFGIAEDVEGYNDTYVMITSAANLKDFQLSEAVDTGIIEIENDYSLFTENFSLKNPNKIKKFLSSNTFLLNIILESKSVVHRYFGETTELEVELFTDPEDIEELPRLFVNIKTKSDVKTALESFDNFLDNWYLEKMLLSGSLLSFNIEYL